jgi:hypothetical protein
MNSAVAILQNDPARAKFLASEINSVAESVLSAGSLPEFLTLVSEFSVQVGVVDLGLISFEEIVRLRHHRGIEIICTHHTPDDVMWSGALDAGALDCCFDDDGRSICRAILQSRMAANQAVS